MMSGKGPSSHPIGDMKTSSAESLAVAPHNSRQLCPDHNQPLLFFCQACNVSACGHCAITGQHRGHSPVVTVQEMAQELKDEVQAKAKKFKDVLLPQAETALEKVKKVTSELTAWADDARANVRLASQRAVATIQACEHQKLEEVNDIEVVELKSLDKQKGELNYRVESLKGVISFAEKVTQDGDGAETGIASQSGSVATLLEAVKARADVLEKMEQSETPDLQPRLSFQAISDEDLPSKAGELLGVVMPCEASAAHRCMEGDGQSILTAKRVTRKVIWLDQNVHSGENSGIARDLCADGVHLLATADIDTAMRAAKCFNDVTELRIVTAGHGGEEFVRLLRDAKIVSKILVFCMAVRYHRTWASRFSDVQVTNVTEVLQKFAKFE